ncbi:MAG TPA: hypothetical protein VM097_05200 [Mycobacteriales bacterium]|nr:hypothetical protein [Mycobacteriales bacterium]
MPYALELRQRFTAMQNRYDLIGFHDGAEQVLGYAEQKRMAIKEKVTFFANDAKTEVAFTVGARSFMEINATYDIQAADGSVLATIKKSFGSSLLRSTYEVVTADGRQLVCQERTMWKALFRRFIDIPLFAVQFDLLQDGHVLATIDRQMKLRDVYRVEVQDDAFDWRVAGAITVAQDAFMNR